MRFPFNPALLTIARQLRGYNQRELAQLSDISQGHLSKLEHGIYEPSIETLDRLAMILNVPVGFFSQPDHVYGLPASVHGMHRKKAQATQRQLDSIHAQVNQRVMHLRRLLQSAEFEAKLPLPTYDLDEYRGDAEIIANMVRRAWFLPSGPIRNLTLCLEQAGVLIVCCDFHGAAVDAVSYAIPELPPCIFLNKERSADRMRFTLAHELGHLVMHRIPSQDMESEADAFASALLMPAADIKGHLAGRITLAYLATFKPIWKVSIQSLLMRAGRLGMITPHQNKYLWQQISASKMRFNEPPELDFPHDEPKVLPELLRFHLEELNYSLTDLANVMHIYESELQDLYGLPGEPSRGGHLRLIRHTPRPNEGGAA